jgi:hypothetical protein
MGRGDWGVAMVAEKNAFPDEGKAFSKKGF